ncbi:hypothetical protein E4U43_008396 [Claviceps pusilla]|uniref:DNA replication factor Cdt1 C-terminal domain-containing protein n=1 Tax=Claviceps pusilla TaxID=123648 RepID=A0A9P7NHD9_9HYPO|nr:hypothetical protein E4U43_008396 [Claviceps pusilla]
MPRPSVKRREAVEAVPSSNAITNFARVAKSQAYRDASAKTSLVVELPAARASRKRKAGSLDQDNSTQLPRRTVSFPPSSGSSSDDDEASQDRTISKRSRRAEPPKPCSSAEAADTASSPSIKAATSTKGKRVAKAAPSITKAAHRPSKSTIIAQSVQQQQQRTAQTKIDAIYKKKTEKNKAKDIREAKVEDGLLPSDLVELAALNKAFLKTITIYIAHNGCSSPIDIRLIAPDISRTWGKRRVTVEDIRRCIAIQSHKQPPHAPRFIVTDYGRARICVEVVPGSDGVRFDQERLCREFEDNMRALCAEQAVDQMTDVDVPLARMSLSDLPRVAIQDMCDATKANPLFSRGQKALDDLKTGIAAKKQEQQDRQQAGDKLALLNPDGTKMSLLDRIRHKQLAKANEPIPPSGPELQRRAALNRVADVAATISMLSLSNPMASPRQAYTMMAIADKLKDSLRVPLSKDEAMTCVRIIATEIAPHWLRIVSIGGRENVVIQRHGQPIDRVINERVQMLLAA